MRNARTPRYHRGRHAQTSIALALTLLAAGSALSCSGDAAGLGDGSGSDDGTEPPVLATLEVTPTAADLCAMENTVQLTILARDQNGAEVPVGAGTATYSSSAPEVAGVSSSGVVTAAAPGTAVITATFALGSISRTASMRTTVHEAPAEYPEIAGVYDVTAQITGSGWGAEGTRETAVITIRHSRDTPRFAGTFEDFRFFDPGHDESTAGPFSGSVSGSFNCVGQVAFELGMEGLQSSLWYAEGTLTPQEIVGVFWDPGANFGTFTAERRQAQ